MRKIALALAALACLSAPAFAQSTPVASTLQLAQADINVRIGDRDRSRTVVRERHRGPDVVVRDRRGPGWRHMARGCKTVTIRERRGGHVMIKKIRRCG